MRGVVAKRLRFEAKLLALQSCVVDVLPVRSARNKIAEVREWREGCWKQLYKQKKRDYMAA